MGGVHVLRWDIKLTNLKAISILIKRSLIIPTPCLGGLYRNMDYSSIPIAVDFV
jgi:hypothetical protein